MDEAISNANTIAGNVLGNGKVDEEARKPDSKGRNSKLKPLPPPLRERERAGLIRVQPRNLVKHGLIPEISWLKYCHNENQLEVQLIDEGNRYVCQDGEVRDFKSFKDVSKAQFADELGPEETKDVWFISELQGAPGRSLRELEAQLDSMSSSRLEDECSGDEAYGTPSQNETRRSSSVTETTRTCKLEISVKSQAAPQNRGKSKFQNIQGKKYRRRSQNFTTVIHPERTYAKRSLFIFDLNNPLRRAIISGIESPWWDRCVLSVIFLNTFFLAMYDPFDTPDWRECELGITDPYGYCSWHNETWRLAPAAGSMLLSGKSWPPFHRDFLDFSSKIFSAFFILEFVAKIIALRFMVGPNT